ncbi:MAG: hypothetical protein J6R32_04560 [Bacteroidales bacterium]|nr:hypothetical protein [Bacteroidales bacterium]
MDIILGKYNDDPRRVGKTMTDTVTISMSPIETTDLMNPKFVCDYNASLLLYNYASVTDFSRKYFVDPPEIIRGGRLSFQFHVDVLEVNGLMDCNATITRNQYKRDIAVEDKLLPLQFGQVVPDPNSVQISLTPGVWPAPLTGTIYFDYLITR